MTYFCAQHVQVHSQLQSKSKVKVPQLPSVICVFWYNAANTSQDELILRYLVRHCGLGHFKDRQRFYYKCNVIMCVFDSPHVWFL